MKIPKATELPSGSYRIRLNLGGQRVSVTEKSEKEAIKKAELLTVQYEHGLKMDVSGPSVKLGVAIDRYIEARENILSPSTIRGYQAYRSTRFQPYMNRQLNQIDWQRAVNAEAKTGCSPKTLKNAWGLIRSALSENGMDVTVRLPAQTPHEKEWLTPEQIPLFMSAIRDKPGEIGALLALSGLRRSEIYGLDWKDVDLSNKVIHVKQSMVLNDKAEPVVRKQNKTASSTRDVPIFIQRLYDALSAVPDKTGMVVLGNIGTLRKRITTACATAELPDIGVHGLRHSFCSLCYSLGISELGAMRLGGWNDFQTMRKVYTHLSELDENKSAEKLTAFFKMDTKMDTPEEESLMCSGL